MGPWYQLLTIAKSTLIVEKWVRIFSRSWLDHGQKPEANTYFIYNPAYSMKLINVVQSDKQWHILQRWIVQSWSCLLSLADALKSYPSCIYYYIILWEYRYTGCCSMLMNRIFISTMASVYWIIFVEMCIVHHILSTWISVACSRHKARHWNLTRGIILYNTSAIRCWPSLFYWEATWFLLTLVFVYSG